MLNYLMLASLIVIALALAWFPQRRGQAIVTIVAVGALLLGWHPQQMAFFVLAIATLNFDQMALIVANTGGGVQSLPPGYLVGGRRHGFIASLVLAAQASGTTFGVARIFVPFVMTDITLVTDTSLATATIALGDTNTPNLWMAAQTLTATDTPTKVGKTAALGVVQTTGYDSTTGNQVTAYAPGEGGAQYEDVTMLTAVAALPAAGNLRIFFEYMID